ncbi:MAG: hypothetical protein Q9174_000153 [Haloplaca sp. 1 TL-2023]
MSPARKSTKKENARLDATLGADGNQGQLGVTERIVEQAALYHQRLQQSFRAGSSTELIAHCQQLSSDYYILRIRLAWCQDRLDLAEIMMTKLNSDGAVEAVLAENLADLLFEIGRDQAAKRQYSMAVRWLEKARDVLVRQQPEELGNDAMDVMSCVLHTTVHVLLKEPSEDNRVKAWSIIHELEGRAANKVSVALLKLELLTLAPEATQEYSEVLLLVVRHIQISDVNIRTVLHHTHQLRGRCTRMAHGVLVVLLTERLLSTSHLEWIEKTIVTIIWNITTSTDLLDRLNTLEELLETVATGCSAAIRTPATHAAQIVSLILPRPAIGRDLGLMTPPVDIETDRVRV